MTTRLTAIPDTITAGDSVAVTLTYPDYPAPTWVVSAVFAGASVLSKTTTASGTDHNCDLTAGDTASLASGAYSWRLRATDGSTTTTVATGSLVVFPDLATLADGDAVGYAEKMLPIVEAALQGIVEGEAKMMMIAGRQLMSLSTAELMKLRAQFNAELSAARGDGLGTAIRFGFRSVLQ